MNFCFVITESVFRTHFYALPPTNAGAAAPKTGTLYSAGRLHQEASAGKGDLNPLTLAQAPNLQ